MIFKKNKNDGAVPAGAADNTDVIVDVTDATFEQAVLLASMDRPVLVDFWAGWCAPCRQLTPILEKLVRAHKGALVLAKVDTEANQGIAAALRIQSLPTVYAFFQGRPVDGFQGALPESQVKAFIEKILKLAGTAAPPGAMDIPAVLKAAGEALAAGRIEEAQGLYAAILDQDPARADAYAGMVKAVLAGGHLAEAQQLADQAPPEIAAAPEFAPARTALELARLAPSAPLPQLEARLAADPADHQARYDLALAEYAAGRRESAIDHLLEITRRNRGWNEEAARKHLVKLFEVMGPADPLTLQGRRKLSSILFS